MDNSSSTSSSKWVIAQVAIGVAIALIGLNILLHYAMRGLDSNDATTSGLDSTQAADVLFIGDSRTNQGLDPRTFEAESEGQITALNMGRAGMQAPMFYFVARDYLENAPKPPKAIVMNISFYMLGGRQWFEDIYLAYYNPKAWQITDAVSTQLITGQEAVSWYVGTRIPMFRYRKRISGLVQAFANDPSRGIFAEHSMNLMTANLLRDENNKGYLSRGVKEVEKITEEEYGYYKIGLDNGYSIYIDYLKRFFDLAARYRVHVIIYPFPWPEEAKASQNFQTVFTHYEKKVRDHAAGNPYVHFVDYDYYWPNKYFVDPLHLNQQGADILTRLAFEWVQPYVPARNEQE